MVCFGGILLLLLADGSKGDVYKLRLEKTI